MRALLICLHELKYDPDMLVTYVQYMQNGGSMEM